VHLSKEHSDSELILLPLCLSTIVYFVVAGGAEKLSVDACADTFAVTDAAVLIPFRGFFDGVILVVDVLSKSTSFSKADALALVSCASRYTAAPCTPRG
jgi:hypothetical protein